MWELYADKAQQSLLKYYWNEEIQSFHHETPPDTSNDRLMYWWFAHAIDVLLDGYERTKDEAYIKLADKSLDGIIKRNKGTVLHNWYDDMEWFALALLRFYDITKEAKYKELVYILWNDILTAWNEHMGGGLAWRKNQLDYKNTPANAPAAIIGARLYQRFQDNDAYQWAKKIYEWNRDNLQDSATGFVWDGMNREGDGKIDKDWEYTYCQGVMIGACIELYRCEGQKDLLENAKRILDISLKKLVSKNGVLQDEGENDAGLFKGILVRYLSILSEQCPEVKETVNNLFEKCAESMLENMDKERFLFGSSWEKQPGERIELSCHLSGIMLLEAISNSV